MRVSERLIVPLRPEGTPLLPPSRMAGREIVVLAKEGCPNISSSDIAVIAAFNKGFPSEQGMSSLANDDSSPTQPRERITP